jgi:hypothetical protein
MGSVKQLGEKTELSTTERGGTGCKFGWFIHRFWVLDSECPTVFLHRRGSRESQHSPSARLRENAGVENCSDPREGERRVAVSFSLGVHSRRPHCRRSSRRLGGRSRVATGREARSPARAVTRLSPWTACRVEWCVAGQRFPARPGRAQRASAGRACAALSRPLRPPSRGLARPSSRPPPRSLLRAVPRTACRLVRQERGGPGPHARGPSGARPLVRGRSALSHFRRGRSQSARLQPGR